MHAMAPQTTVTTFEQYVSILTGRTVEILKAPKIDNATAQTAVETVRPARKA